LNSIAKFQTRISVRSEIEFGKENPMKKTLLLILSLLLTLALVAAAAFQVGKSSGKVNGMNASQSISISLGETVQDEAAGTTSFQIYVDIAGKLDHDQKMSMLCKLADQKDRADFQKFDVTYRDGYYNWNRGSKPAELICWAEISGLNGEILRTSNSLTLYVPSAQ
jgi:hypothetical protein